MTEWGSVADWFVAVGTLVLAAVALFQDAIRRWIDRPKFRVSSKSAWPDCGAVPITRASDGAFIADSIYLHLWIENIGNVTAMNTEVYAQELRRLRADGTLEKVEAFFPMNLNWANLGGIYFNIAPEMGKHCDLGHIVDPARRHLMPHEHAPQLGLSDRETSLAFDLMARPNNKCHIIGPGEYQLDIFVAAENARPIKRIISISLKGMWDPDEQKMLRDGIGIFVSSAD